MAVKHCLTCKRVTTCGAETCITVCLNWEEGDCTESGKTGKETGKKAFERKCPN